MSDTQAPVSGGGESFTCPECGSHWFGTDSSGEEWVISCHGDGCSWRGSHLQHVEQCPNPRARPDTEQGEG